MPPQGGRILKFQGMKRNESNDVVGKVLTRSGGSNGQIKSLKNNFSGSSSHLENKREIQNFITNVPSRREITKKPTN
jgi:hypothetical protein